MLRVLFFVVLLPGFASAQMTYAEKKATALYILGLHDDKSGGYRVDAKAEPSLRATSGAVRSLNYLNAAKLEVAIPDTKLTSTFVTSHYDAHLTAFLEKQGKPDVTITSIGLMTVAELQLPLKFASAIKYLEDNAKTFEDVRIAAAACEAMKVKPKTVDAWIKLADAQLNNDGTAGKGEGQARDTASVAAMKLRLGYPVANKAKVTDAILNGQRPDGGWGKADAKASDLETSYRVMRALYLLKAKPKDAKAVSDFLGKCRNKDGGYSVEPGGASTMSGVYYATAINKWLEK